MLTRDDFHRRFGARPLFGMIHLKPLPGAPLFGGSMMEIVESALRDAVAWRRGGADALIVENFGDRPFFRNRVPAETIAALTRVATDLKRAFDIPLGINVLRNDACAALAIAAATGADFIRVNVHTGVMLTDQGMIEGEAAATLRLRASIAPTISIFADHRVKHAQELGPVDDRQSARDLRLRGLCDAIIVTGPATGAAIDPMRLVVLREAVDTPLLAGSGITVENAAELAPLVDGMIVGTWAKRNGDVSQPVDPERVERLCRKFKGDA
jgi:membrane complex biogenesis BtpA family protein